MFHRLRNRAKGQEGFTLIELLVVILIIGILAAVAIPAFLSQKSKANDANTKSDVRTAQTSEETYFTDAQLYTPTAVNLTNIEPTLTQAFKTVALGGDAMTLASPATAIQGGTLTGGAATTGNSYDIIATSASGVLYGLIREPDGTVQRTCTVPAGKTAGGCKLAGAAVTGNGTW